MKYLKILILLFVLLLGIGAVSAHGVDITNDTMVIADGSNGQLIKSIADANGINISVYKFNSADEVAHILEHSVNNTNKRILVLAYQNIAKDFLKNHSEVSNRIIVVDDVNNDTILKGLHEIFNVETGNTGESNFGVPLIIGAVIGILAGIGCGVLIMKKKN